MLVTAKSSIPAGPKSNPMPSEWFKEQETKVTSSAAKLPWNKWEKHITPFLEALPV
jgi:hypothetical protein